ncbi:MAG TPA: alpha/beta hydrolase [Pseudonocardiaceae bacterium]|jgi:pimeloyl-ACP methyl ester carboxylesterase|nr:alpha/beta hydrolase [Pseudonocardiaceae bacterium]
MTELTSGYAPVNGVDMYFESVGEGGVPVVLTHGGYGLTTMLADVRDELCPDRRVLSVELQGHGHTADIDRPFRYESFGDDLAAFVEHLGLDQVDLVGYSLGGGASLRATIQHPDVVRRLALISTPFRREAWFPDIRAQMAQMSSALFDQFKQTPLYPAYAAVAPDVDGFRALIDKTGDLLRTEYDWSDEVRAITTPTLLVFADADSMPTSEMARNFGLLGGGQADGNFDGSSPSPMRLAVLPGRTHYNVTATPGLGSVVRQFLDAT